MVERQRKPRTDPFGVVYSPESSIVFRGGEKGTLKVNKEVQKSKEFDRGTWYLHQEIMKLQMIAY